MIRRAIFGKVHGHGVKEIWLISQLPAKHTGVASGAKIVFARPGLARLLGCGNGIINNEFIIYTACSPQSDCISFFSVPEIVEDHNGAPRLEMPRDHPRVVQHSRYQMQSWRANGDASLILSNSPPEILAQMI